MGWIKSDYRYDTPIAQLTLSERELASLHSNGVDEATSLAIALKHQDPEVVEKAVLDLIGRFNPTLKGGILLSIQHIHFGQWAFTYAHPSLLRTPDCAIPPSRPLILQYQVGGILITKEQDKEGMWVESMEKVDPIYRTSEFPIGGWKG